MNNPEDIAIDVEEQRDWINQHKLASGMTWRSIAGEIGIAMSTLSLFGGNTYPGNEQKIATQVFKYRQMLTSQAEVGMGVPDGPGFLRLPTALRLRSLLITAQRGRMTLGCTGPGTGKTSTVTDYAESVSNVWLATMSPATKSLQGMISEVRRAVGASGKTSGWTRHMAAEVAAVVRGKRGVIVIDDAHQLELDSFEQLCSWHDMTGVGICCFGNEELFARIDSGKRSSHAYGRLNSRIADRHIQDMPRDDDIEGYLDGWALTDLPSRKLLMAIGRTPGTGGLREIWQILEAATLLAHEDGRPIAFADVRDAQAMRATRYIRVAT